MAMAANDNNAKNPLQDVDLSARRLWLEDGIKQNIRNQIRDMILPSVVQE